MIIIDANYFLALHDSADSLYQKAISVSSRIVGQSVLYLEDVLKEVQTIIAVRKSHSQSFAWIDSIYENELDADRQYNLSPMEFFEVLNEWRSLKDARMSFVDAEILYLSKKYGYPVLSFDEEIKKRLPKDLVFA